jgi:DNA polymerase-3 subunit alpha
VLAIPQLKPQAMRWLLRRFRATRLEDIVQALALSKPGPSRHTDEFLRWRRGEQPPRFPHPDLEGLLAESGGVMLYEDHALRAIQILTGWDGAGAERARRQLADKATADRAAEAVVAACSARGVDPGEARHLTERLREQKAYTFCKAHAVATALVCWREARLRANHPLCSWAVSLEHHSGNYPLWLYVEAMKRAGLHISLPCVNQSLAGWSQEVRSLRPGLRLIRGLSEESVGVILDNRKRGAFSSLTDFRTRLPNVKGAELAALIRCGAFDFTRKARSVLLADARVEGFGVSLAESHEPWPFDRTLPGLPESRLCGR